MTAIVDGEDMAHRLMFAAALAVVAVACIVAGIRIHRHHVDASQLTAARRFARGISIQDSEASAACPDSGEISCVATRLLVPSATKAVASAMRSTDGVPPRVRCFHGVPSRDTPAMPYTACVVDVRFGSHLAFAWVNVNPAANNGSKVTGSTISLDAD
jgi:hypothetical protein